MKIKINDRNIGEGYPPYVIAEMSANHNGSLERALATIEAAQRCGVDAIKLQTYTAETITMNCDSQDFIVKGGLWDGYKLYDLYKWAETPYEWHEAMFKYAKNLGVTIFSTPFDETSVDLLEKLNTPAYKIASFELVDLPLIKYVATTGKPMIISTGMASEIEIEEAVNTAYEAGCKALVLLHCISSYPAPIEQAQVSKVPALSKRFGVLAGLSDHTLGKTASIASVALGACLIEKHFTLNRSDKGPDSEFSLEPDEFESLCKDLKNTWLALGTTNFERQISEEVSKNLRRSIYFAKDLPINHIISSGDIRRVRPGYGLPPKYFEDLIGRKLLISVKHGEATKWEYFE
jgi:N-acetylneuraminate synthase